MDRTEMLHQMCRTVLADTEVKAISKNRGFPAETATSRKLLESLFLSDAGVAEVFESLERDEIALLHLLAAIGKPVDLSFFARAYGTKGTRVHYLTFTQRYQSVLTKVKQRLVRQGILLMALGRKSSSQKAKMERWLFALPVQFESHLPSLVESPRQFEGDGNWRRDVARDKLKTAAGKSPGIDSKSDRLEIVDGELRWGGQPFRANRLLTWQKVSWQASLTEKKSRKGADTHALPPADAAVRIFSGLPDSSWVDPPGLAAPLNMFCGHEVDSEVVCEAGWRWGCLARQESDGTTWYRMVSSPPAAEVPVHHYLDVAGDGTVVVDLDTVPFESLEHLAAICSLQAGRGASGLLLATPNLVKLGRATDAVLALPLVEWLGKNSPAFGEAIKTLGRRRGKTIVHENLSVARVSDLSLKAAIEKALGDRIVSLADDYIAFPHMALNDVKRVVTKSGHVVKEVSTP